MLHVWKIRCVSSLSDQYQLKSRRTRARVYFNEIAVGRRALDQLEAEMMAFSREWDRSVDGSPNRLDAMIWGITRLSKIIAQVPLLVGQDDRLIWGTTSSANNDSKERFA